MQLVPLIPGWAKGLAALAVPALFALSPLVPAPYTWIPLTLGFLAAYFTGQAIPTPKWAAGKPLVQGPLVPLLASAVPVLMAFAQSLPAGGIAQWGVYAVALAASGLAGLASPEPLTVVPSTPAAPGSGTTVQLAEGCSLADAAQGKCSL